MDSYMGIIVNDLTYKSKIKGFHLAFNIVQPKLQEGNSNYKFRMDPKFTADELKLKVAQSKQKRILDKEVKEMDEKLKYQRDREELRKMHERMRLKKMQQLMDAENGVDVDTRKKQYQHQAKL